MGAVGNAAWRELSYEAQDGLSITGLAAYLSVCSRQLAHTLHKRAKLYLWIGCAIASMGLVFFYFGLGKQVADVRQWRDLGVQDIVVLIRNLGVAVFIEYVAVFFLMQYRHTMNDFRYFQRIQRRREELLLAIKITGAKDVTEAMRELVKKDTVFSSAPDAEAAPNNWAKVEKQEIEFVHKMFETYMKWESEKRKADEGAKEDTAAGARAGAADSAQTRAPG
ncbi:hypothetical protein [Pseudoduganella chitinolytica]|uniref:Uncharacterized protein n=1 Tax=Pseudoduganella chitinolytica TaxID=34070 RepID=A0ABY8BEZ9_9BURK|nr:hypothetical protein [Pseudoduganella chitinolytica]WEF34286.1 hypothetical protein PX653_05805 [Pseudoduganella chitinolytica]